MKTNKQLNNMQQSLIDTKLNATTMWMSETDAALRYEQKILKDRKYTSFALTVHRNLKKKTGQFLNSLQRKVHLLEIKAKKAEKQGIGYKQKLQKLYDVQVVQNNLFKQRQENKIKQLYHLENKQQVCSTIKFTNQKNLQLIKGQRKNMLMRRMSNIKQQYRQSDLIRQKTNQKIYLANRQKYEKVKLEEQQLKNRMRKIQEFKLIRARKNYLDKIDYLMTKTKEKQFQLKELQLLEQSQLQVLRKTQQLQLESRKVQKMYSNFFPTAMSP